MAVHPMTEPETGERKLRKMLCSDWLLSLIYGIGWVSLPRVNSMRIYMNLNRIRPISHGVWRVHSRFANIEYESELTTPRPCYCTQTGWLSKRTSFDLGCGKLSWPQTIGSSSSHSAAEEFQAYSWCRTKWQTQYLRSRRVFGPWIEGCISPEQGGVTRGIPTSFTAEPLKSGIASSSDLPPVWPWHEGDTGGIGLEPLYKNVPHAALRVPAFYQLLAEAAKLLGPILGELMFVGGFATTSLIGDKAADVRPTLEMDAIAEITC
jgi:hypothetical protein